MAPFKHDTSSLSSLISNDFDFIIVGGGTSGLVVASRLTEDPKCRVLVIEAGANRLNDPRIMVPGLATMMYDDPEFDWKFISTPQEHLNGRLIAQPRGRTLGGSSAINLCMVVYPSKSGFDAWQSLGNQGWNWDSISPYLRKFHTLAVPSKEISDMVDLNYLDLAAQGYEGPVKISFGESGYTTFNEAWSKTFKTLGYPLTGDPIYRMATGAFTNPGSINPTAKTRSHAGSSYFNDEVAGRSNLIVLTEALVERVILEPKSVGDFIATGVQVMKGGCRFVVQAKNEVILAAGTIKSPQLLELSGIGGAELLKSHDIEVIVDNLNVGENLQDHGFVPHSWEVTHREDSGDQLREVGAGEAALSAYETTGSRPLGTCSIISSFMPLVDVSESEFQALLKHYSTFSDHSHSISQQRQYKLLLQILGDPKEASGQYTLVPS